jgi:hypothetical protein
VQLWLNGERRIRPVIADRIRQADADNPTLRWGPSALGGAARFCPGDRAFPDQYETPGEGAGSAQAGGH